MRGTRLTGTRLASAFSALCLLVGGAFDVTAAWAAGSPAHGFKTKDVYCLFDSLTPDLTCAA